jgi:hypothetical protein
MTKDELCKFIGDKPIHWTGEKLFLRIPFGEARTFTSLIEEYLNGVTEFAYIAKEHFIVDLVDICDHFGIVPADILPTTIQ